MGFSGLQAQRQEAEVQRLTTALAAAPKEDPNAPSSKLTMQKLVTEVGGLLTRWCG